MFACCCGHTAHHSTPNINFHQLLHKRLVYKQTNISHFTLFPFSFFLYLLYTHIPCDRFFTTASGEPLVQQDSERCDDDVGKAMVNAAATVGVHGKVNIVSPTIKGAHVVHVAGDTQLRQSSQHMMRYRSTRSEPSETEGWVTFEAAVMRGLAPDGGL
jgi:hypothetical protein